MSFFLLYFVVHHLCISVLLTILYWYRIKKLIDMEALGLSRLTVIVLDMYTDVKGYSLFTLPQVRFDLLSRYSNSGLCANASHCLVLLTFPICEMPVVLRIVLSLSLSAFYLPSSFTFMNQLFA